MQAPHKPAPQPNFVPVSFNPSRITHSNGVSSGASLVAGRPFTTKFVDIDSSSNLQLAEDCIGLVQSCCRDEGMAMVEFVLILAAAEPRLHGWRFSPEELGKLLKSEIASMERTHQVSRHQTRLIIRLQHVPTAMNRDSQD